MHRLLFHYGWISARSTYVVYNLYNHILWVLGLDEYGVISPNTSFLPF